MSNCFVFGQLLTQDDECQFAFVIAVQHAGLFHQLAAGKVVRERADFSAVFCRRNGAGLSALQA
jgi:hypothetical protein